MPWICYRAASFVDGQATGKNVRPTPGQGNLVHWSQVTELALPSSDLFVTFLCAGRTVAQSVEHKTFNFVVGSSILPGPTFSETASSDPVEQQKLLSAEQLMAMPTKKPHSPNKWMLEKTNVFWWLWDPRLQHWGWWHYWVDAVAFINRNAR